MPVDHVASREHGPSVLTCAEARMVATADAMNARIANCHTEVSCPKCLAPVGTRCRSMPRGYRPLDLGPVKELKTPHRQRWTRVVPAR